MEFFEQLCAIYLIEILRFTSIRTFWRMDMLSFKLLPSAVVSSPLTRDESMCYRCYNLNSIYLQTKYWVELYYYSKNCVLFVILKKRFKKKVNYSRINGINQNKTTNNNFIRREKKSTLQRTNVQTSFLSKD